jgi:mono/diheme cytochrome c family protein
MNLVLSGLLVLVVMLVATTRVDYARPNIEILPDMKYTPASLAYARNAVFANGRTLQAPVPGTIARGRMPLHYTATKEDALRAGEELTSPFQDGSVTDATGLPASIRRGGETFRVFCISCHGPSGAGDGPVAKRGYPPPPSLTTGNSIKMKDGQLFHILSYGQNSMPDFAAQLSPAERWDVINYVRALQPDSQEPLVETVTDADESQALPPVPPGEQPQENENQKK